MKMQECAPVKKPAVFQEVTRPEPAMISPAPAHDAIGRASLFSNLSAPGREKVISAGRAVSFRRRQMLFAPGDPVKHVLLLTAGCVKTQQDSSNGNAVILRLSGPGDLVDACGLEGRVCRQATACALSHCAALVWSTAVFEGLSNRFPVLQRNLSRMVSGYLLDLEKRFCEIATESTHCRVGHEISRLAQRIGEKSNGAIRIRISQEDLAQLTGTTLYTVSRVLSRWKELGAVATGREYIEILNSQRLEEIWEAE